MFRQVAIRRLLLVLLIGASHLALVSHVTAHFQPELEQCELCVSQAQPQAAIPSAETPPPARPANPSLLPRPESAWRQINPACPCLQRGPPATSS